MENKPQEVLTEITEAPTEITEPVGGVEEQSPPITRHSILHSGRPAMCCVNWDEMEGGDVSRVCPQCGATAYRVETMDDSALVRVARYHRADFANIIAFRKTDGTYVFTSKNCSPKSFLAPQRDLGGVMITNWWYDRYSRYNWYLLWFGLVVGSITTIICSIRTGIPQPAAFFFYAIVCALFGNLLFGIAILANVVIPKAIAPVRRYAGPALLVTSIAATVLFICWPITTFILHP
jgi:hypothetical protein